MHQTHMQPWRASCSSCFQQLKLGSTSKHLHRNQLISKVDFWEFWVVFGFVYEHRHGRDNNLAWENPKLRQRARESARCRAASWSVRVVLRRPTLEGTRVGQGYLSLQTGVVGGISGVNEVCAGLTSDKSPSNWRETYYTGKDLSDFYFSCCFISLA